MITKSQHLNLFSLKNFEIETLHIESEALKENPWGDPYQRNIPILVPRTHSTAASWPTIFVLSGFSSNAPKFFNWQSFQDNFPQELDRAVSEDKAPKALYVFIDAFSSIGGSQFINSPGIGRYQDFFVNEVVPAVKQHYSSQSHHKNSIESKNIKNKDINHNKDDVCPNWAILGGSSGGYGALHLSSQFPQLFPYCLAIAPDSFFSMSLLPEIYKAYPYIQKIGGLSQIIETLKIGDLQKHRHFHLIINVVAMGLCYAAQFPENNNDDENKLNLTPNKNDLSINPNSALNKTYSASNKTSKYPGILWPINDNGEVNAKIWNQWTQFDPLEFLPQRSGNIKQLKGVYLDAGVFDQYHLQFGTRQIYDILKPIAPSVKYSEFEGNHFDIGRRRLPALEWLQGQWQNNHLQGV